MKFLRDSFFFFFNPSGDSDEQSVLGTTVNLGAFRSLLAHNEMGERLDLNPQYGVLPL